VQVQGENVVGSPFQISVVPVDFVWPSNCIAYGANLTNGTAGFIGNFLVQTKDLLDNNITDNHPNLTWTVTFTDDDSQLPVHCQYTVVYLQGGLYIINYNVTIAALFDLSIQINETAIQGSPFTNVIVPGPTYAPNCRGWGDGLGGDTLISDKQTSFTLQSQDAFHNLRMQGNDSYQIVITESEDASASSVTTPELTDNQNGTYSGTYTLGTSGHYYVYVSINSVQISGSPFEVDVKWKGLSTTTVVLIVLGCVVGVALIIAGVWIYRVKFRKRSLYQPLPEKSTTLEVTPSGENN